MKNRFSRREIAAKTVLLDPVALLLAQPDVAYNFLYRQAETTDLGFWWVVLMVKLMCLPSLKLTVRHGKLTILMVFTRKDRDFPWLGYVSVQGGSWWFQRYFIFTPTTWGDDPI